MKITKIKTKAGTFGSPVSAELGAIVERMQSADIKVSADRIAAIALHSRLMMEQGAPRYFIEDTDRLPHLSSLPPSARTASASPQGSPRCCCSTSPVRKACAR